MATPEQFVHAGAGETRARENLDPNHFYAAYVFDNPGTRRRDITVLIDQAQKLERPVRYWWLSEAMDRFGDLGDRLIVCVHHPSGFVDAGMDLHRALETHEVTWDDLEAARVDEYRRFGKITTSPATIFEPDGAPVFPEPDTDVQTLFALAITPADVQFIAQESLHRELTSEEMEVVRHLLPRAIGWIASVESAITAGQFLGRVGPAAVGREGLERK